MRCLSCNCNLSDFESTRKYPDGEYVDMCQHCFNKSDLMNIPVIVREDLVEYEDVNDEFDFENEERDYE